MDSIRFLSNLETFRAEANPRLITSQYIILNIILQGSKYFHNLQGILTSNSEITFNYARVKRLYKNALIHIVPLHRK